MSYGQPEAQISQLYGKSLQETEQSSLLLHKVQHCFVWFVKKIRRVYEEGYFFFIIPEKPTTTCFWLSKQPQGSWFTKISLLICLDREAVYILKHILLFCPRAEVLQQWMRLREGALHHRNVCAPYSWVISSGVTLNLQYVILWESWK